MNHPRFIVGLALLLTSATAAGQELAVDHVYIRVSRGAPEAQVLADAGFRFERFDRNAIAPVASRDPRIVKHEGQGTASMVVRFRNLYLELIWVEDRDLLLEVAPQHGYTLLEPGDTSPIGIGLRHVGEDAASLPFPSSSHWAPWMRPNVSLATARRDVQNPAEPAIFVIPRYLRWDLRIQKNPGLLESAKHRLDLGEVSRIRIHGPGLPSGSDAVQILRERHLVEFLPAEDHLLELEFDRHRESQLDLRPTLPLLISY